MKIKRPFNFNIRALDDNEYEIAIHGVIGEYVDYARWTISDTEQDVLNELKQIPEGKKIHVRINSRGGDVGLGLGIYNALVRRQSDVTTYNDGYAMSAASIVMLAGSRRVSPKASIWMIHRATGGIEGTGKEMRSYADGMDTIDSMMAKVYAEACGGKKTAAEFETMMDKTTWFDGEEACNLGLATHCEGEIPEPDDDDEITDVEKQIIARFEKTIPTNLRAKFERRSQTAATGPRAQAGDPANQPQPTTESMNKITAALIAAGFTSLAADAKEEAVLPIISSIIAKNGELKAANDKHEKALKDRVTAKVEKAIADKLIKAERKDALIKAGVADESTLEFIDDIRAESATHRPRGAKPAARGEGEDTDPEAEIKDLNNRINGDCSAEERGELVAQSIKARGLDGLFKKRTEVKPNGN